MKQHIWSVKKGACPLKKNRVACFFGHKSWKKPCLYIFFSFVFSFADAFAFANTPPTLPSDVDYYIHDNPSFSLIFGQTFLNEEKDFIHLHERLSYYDDVYKEVFSRKLNEKPIYVFASSRNQTTNARAFSIPFLRVVFFPSGVLALRNMAVVSYIDTVVSHEMAHIFQMGQTSDKIKYLKPLFRNSEFILVPFPVFLNPNLSLSLFFLEGHAVLSESLFAPGGRMYSGAIRALVFSQIKHRFQNTNQFTRNYLVNITEDTFANDQPYAHGGYFWTALLDKYDIKTINNIFLRHAEHFIVPLSFISVKDAFTSTFKTSFESLVHYYIQKYRPMSTQQAVARAKTLFQSRVCLPFNKNQDEVFFLVSNLKSTPRLKTWNLFKEEWKTRRKTLAPGKVFKVRGRYHVSTNSPISPVERVYGLFSEGMYLKAYKDQKVQDIKGGQVLSIDSTHNMRDFRLLLDGEFYDKVHSSALFGPEGGVYYFKQRGDWRVLHRNKVPLFQFRGFYGKVVEVDQGGTIYFIASSFYGSSLFAWTPEEGIYRVSPSDTILEAVKIKEDQFLVCEVGPESYSYKFTEVQKIPEQPVFYDYPFNKVSWSLSTLTNLSNIKQKQTKNLKVEKESPALQEDRDYLQTLKEMESPDDGEKEAPPVEPQVVMGRSSDWSSNMSLKEKEVSFSSYNSLKNIRFNGIEMRLLRDPITEYNGFVNMGFRDPMEYSAFQLAFQKAFLFPNWIFKSQYVNRAWRLSWSLQYIYKQGLENFSGRREHSYIHELSQGFSFPLFKVGYWQSSLGLTNALSAVELKKEPDRQNWYFITKPQWQIQYRRGYKKGFDLHRHFFLKTAFQYHFKFLEGQPNMLFQARSHYTFHWGWDFYTRPFVNYKMALKPQSLPFRYFDSLKAFGAPEWDISLRKKVFEQTNDYLSTGMKVEKFFETPLYFSRYPLSLKGLAPFLTGAYVQFWAHKENQYVPFLEWTFGLSTVLLFHHKIKVKLGLYSGFSYPLTNWQGKRPRAFGKSRPVGAGQALLDYDMVQNLTGPALLDHVSKNFYFGLRLHSVF